MNINTKKYYGFGAAEILLIIFVLGLCYIITSHLNDSKLTTEDKFLKSGIETRNKLKTKTKGIISKYSQDKKTFLNFRYGKEEFSIGSFSAEKNINIIYKKAFNGSSVKVPPPSYLNSKLKNEKEQLEKSVSYFNVGFYFGTDNASYMAVKLNDDCKVTDFVYDPTRPDTKEMYASCGLIFYDVNAEAEPNILGKDQFVYSLDTAGLQ